MIFGRIYLVLKVSSRGTEHFGAGLANAKRATSVSAFVALEVV
jgi:hypothetical protein